MRLLRGVSTFAWLMLLDVILVASSVDDNRDQKYRLRHRFDNGTVKNPDFMVGTMRMSTFRFNCACFKDVCLM